MQWRTCFIVMDGSGLLPQVMYLYVGIIKPPTFDSVKCAQLAAPTSRNAAFKWRTKPLFHMQAVTDGLASLLILFLIFI